MLMHGHLLMRSHVLANDADPLVLDFQMVVLWIGYQGIGRLCPRGRHGQDNSQAKNTHTELSPRGVSIYHLKLGREKRVDHAQDVIC
jgi:hypothetical protein